jgi:hypothetical protein
MKIATALVVTVVICCLLETVAGRGLADYFADVTPYSKGWQETVTNKSLREKSSSLV